MLAAPELAPALAGLLPPARSDELRRLAARLADAAERFAAAARQLGARTAKLSADWAGPAASAALVDLRVLQQRALDAASAHEQAAQVLQVCAARLDDAGATWQRAEALERQDALERSARSWNPLPAAVDTGLVRVHARRLADQARQDSEDALARAAAELLDLAQRSPVTPEARLSLGDQLSGLGRGAVDAVWGSVVTAAGLSLPRLLADPDGWRESVRDLRDGATHAVTHPGEAGRIAVGWDQLQDGRYGEWAGGFAPDLISGVLSGGAIPMARRGADLADDLDDLAEDVDDLQRVRGRGVDVNAGGPVAAGFTGYLARILDLTPERRQHILDGDEHGNGGGHRYGTNKICKSEFPATWDDDDIIRRVMETARDPETVTWQPDRKTFRVRATHADVLVQAIVDEHGAVVTGYPLKGPGVRRTPCP